VDAVIYHSDTGSLYTSITYTDISTRSAHHHRSGTIGDSYDIATTETTIGPFKTELHPQTRHHYLQRQPLGAASTTSRSPVCAWLAWSG